MDSALVSTPEVFIALNIECWESVAIELSSADGLVTLGKVGVP